MMQNVETALARFDAAEAAMQEGDLAKAHVHISQARMLYPHSRTILLKYLLIAGLYWFSRGDVNTYIEMHDMLGESLDGNSEAVLARAAAQAAKYVRTRDPASLNLARDLVERAKRLEKDRPERLAEVLRFQRFVEERIVSGKLISYEEFKKR
jgi:hypothetical protein